MTIRNEIRLATVDSYDGSYAKVILKQGEGLLDVEDRTIEEVLTVRVNSLSQALPDTGADCLLAFDNTGEAYILGAIGSESQPLPTPTEPGTAVYDNGGIEVAATEGAKLSVKKTDLVFGSLELLKILSDVIQLIGTSTCPPGSPLSNSVNILVEKTKLDSFKV